MWQLFDQVSLCDDPGKQIMDESVWKSQILEKVLELKCPSKSQTFSLEGHYGLPACKKHHCV